ncbi:MAG: glutamine-hydrolyzing GMP synthase [Rickettsiales bacterium]|nr:glutamine-hydrolyzing GMP synthase [Pseudomonadota bacterium]MDA0966716.1 glutamine-hydrolyzing GMP synthase [Pseudomonadota bacterium]MDG4544474.1 glutamine-hydrolyzing GMP synthase [Rickettsiales bacterium]MDG4546626.1 glutamine-hydrolyzing GMP synthase [Rickettsiales bacterium]MDG4548773.1 glutamine-hydrolyzing GMP synthase [Rickettsiales bacterium]
MQEKILIVDFGSQVTQLIARRVREAKVYCEIHPYKKATKEFLTEFSPKAIILSGGPSSVTEGHSPRIGKEIFEFGVPILGICYGQQLICNMLGGKVTGSEHREFGRAYVEIVEESALFEGCWKKGDKYQVWMSHGDRVDALPEGFSVIGKSEGAPYAAIANHDKNIYAVQFHPEVTHTPDGKKLLSNFVHKIAGCSDSWSMSSFLDMEVEKIRKQVGDKKVICGVSGGVDSSVVAALIHKAIGEQLTCIFVDLGILRKDERKEVEDRFKNKFHIPIKSVDASELLYNRIKGVDDPEKKRKIIGNTFIDVFEEEAAKVDGAEFLAQGTLYPDVIESVSVHGDAAVTIKSHHNVGGLPDYMKLKLVEPVRELFKDEVRQLGLELGMDKELIGRHPFPGPGLAIRIPGEITQEKIKILQEADKIYIDAIREAGLYDEIWQAFAVLLPVKTVGVMGDARTYEYVCALRAVTSTDGMTADYYDFSHKFLGEVSTRIINRVKGINRVVYDITSKPPGTIEWE